MLVMADAPSVTIRFNERKGNNEKMLNNGDSHASIFLFTVMFVIVNGKKPCQQYYINKERKRYEANTDN